MGKGLDPYETNGHVDGICCFARPGVVLLHWTDDPESPHYEIVRDAFERLKNERDAHSRKLEIYKLQSASPRMITKGESEGVDIVRGTKPRQEGDPLGSSYINFFIANGGIIVPAYDDEHDMLAIEILSWAFPDRKVVSVPDAREISVGGGNIHCITQQQPNC